MYWSLLEYYVLVISFMQKIRAQTTQTKGRPWVLKSATGSKLRFILLINKQQSTV